MTKDEALRLALEALEMYELETNSEFQRKAITAIKAALEAQDKPMHPQLKAMLEDYFDKCFAESASQRTWLGLTDEEIRKWWASENGLEDCDMCKIDDFIMVAKAIEAKLKEKNNGQ